MVASTCTFPLSSAFVKPMSAVAEFYVTDVLSAQQAADESLKKGIQN